MDNNDYDDTESNEGDGMDNLRRVRRIVVGRVTTMTTTIVVEMTERKLMK